MFEEVKSIIDYNKGKKIGMKNVTDLIDINSIEINEKEPVTNRLLNYVKAVKNPYNFKVNGVSVKVSFSDKKSAHDIGSALVKIASKMGD